MRHCWRAAWFAALVLVCGCSGGGGSASMPQPNPTIPGAGTPAVFDQKITFTIDVPAAASPAAAAGLRRARAAHPLGPAAPAATPVATTPYVSANTGSVLLTLAEVNNVSPQQAPPAIAPIDVPPNCQGSTAGCVIPVSGVPAAIGTDRYFVQTYSGPDATGSLISTGFVDVTVPLKPHTNPSIGGAAALSIGGYVATIALAPAQLSFVAGTPANQSILVQAFDAGGATIIGAAVYATPITVTVADPQNFTLNGSPSVNVPGPLKSPLILHYGGGNSFGTLVQATSQNGSGLAVDASPIAANILPPGSSPTPVPSIGVGPPTPIPSTSPGSSPIPTAIPSLLPTPVPTPKPSPTVQPIQALSLYVADGQTDTVSEYRIASQIDAGTIPNPSVTPSRVFAFDPSTAKSPAIGSAGLSCAATSGTVTGAGNGTAGVAVDSKTATSSSSRIATMGSTGSSSAIRRRPSAHRRPRSTIRSTRALAYPTGWRQWVARCSLRIRTATKQSTGFRSRVTVSSRRSRSVRTATRTTPIRRGVLQAAMPASARTAAVSCTCLRRGTARRPGTQPRFCHPERCSLSTRGSAAGQRSRRSRQWRV